MVTMVSQISRFGYLDIDICLLFVHHIYLDGLKFKQSTSCSVNMNIFLLEAEGLK